MVRLIFAGGVFAEAVEDESWHGPAVASMVQAAESQLAAASGEDFDLLASSAQADQRRTLGRFLARLLLLRPGEASLQRTIDFWVDAQREMLARLQADWPRISHWSRESSSARKVIRVEGGLSDRHDGGRSAAILTFESGWKAVYKPRPMGADAWYARLLDWLNAAGAPLAFPSPRILPKDGYGWMQFVAHKPCRSKAQLRGYYRNAGGLLCLLHLLRATDCHFQNIVACGEHPVLIDAEMLFQPALRSSDDWTVAHTGLLPSFRAGPGGGSYDVSGLGFVNSRATRFEVPEWSVSGVDFKPGRLRATKNSPFPQDVQAQPHLFAAEMEQGFRETHRFVELRPDELLSQLETAAELRVRYLLRETMECYAAWSDEPGLRLAELQPTHRIFSGLREQELAALRRFDVPRFTLAADSRDLHGIRGCFAASGYDLARRGIRQWSDQDRQEQIGRIRVAWGLARLASALAWPTER